MKSCILVFRLSWLVLLRLLVGGVEAFGDPSCCCNVAKIPRGGARDQRDDPHADDSSSSSSSSSIFSSIVRQSSKALAATARGSTQIAADLVRPKEVAWEELVGWWRLDISLEEDALESTPPMTIQITPNGRVRMVNGNGVEEEFPVEFRPASWPRSARLKFGSKKQGFYYECTVQRKLANLDILKLRGRVFVHRRFQGKVQVGSFVGRRRVVVMDEDDIDDNGEFEEGDEYDRYDDQDEKDEEEEEEEDEERQKTTLNESESESCSEWDED